MNQLFGDATTAMPTPAQQAEVDSLMSGRSPVPSLDIRNRQSNLGADHAIPGLDINPPQDGSGKQANGEAKQQQQEGAGGWISRLTNFRKKDRGASGQEYRRIDQDDE